MPTKKDFQKQFEELEEITQSLESGDLDLDKSLKHFEKGLKIAQDLKKQLTKTENKIKELKDKNNA